MSKKPIVSQEGKRGEERISTITNIRAFLGPLPSPKILGEYDTVVSNGAERIFKTFEQQVTHRMELDNKNISIQEYAIKQQFRQSSRGQIFGFVIALIGIGLSIYLALHGYGITAGVFGATTILGLVAVFVTEKRRKEKENTH